MNELEVMQNEAVVAYFCRGTEEVHEQYKHNECTLSCIQTWSPELPV